MPFAAPWVIKHSVDGKEPTRYGNRHPDFVPHGVFRCAGHDDWIVVACSSDAMWPKLCALLKRNDWAHDATMKTAAGRRTHEDAIEQAVEEWTNTRDPDTAMRELQAAGIAAGAARLPVELLKDAQLHARGFIQDVDRAFIGKHPQPGFANLAPDKVEATITPDLLFQAHSSVLDLVFYEGEQFPAEYKESLSSR